MQASDLKVYASPALPSHPVLKFDGRTGCAFVTLRHATWVSHEWGFHVGKWIGRLLVLFAAFWLWGQWEEIDVFIRGVLILLLVLLLGRGIFTVVRRSLQGFLARQLFCRRIRVWFTPKAIAIQSHFFPLGIRFWRHWDRQSIHTRFVVAPSVSASEKHQGLRQRSAADIAHLISARVLRVVLAVDTRRDVWQAGRLAAQRAITIADIDVEDAERLCIVLQAAGALSAGGIVLQPSRHTASQPTQPSLGTDIDS
ncbi:MAG TPA: hypothetical protein DDW52_10645 [Planctomycetaceae bacterium]|nr:hypothetical protein [Planctomycetaceae bacterium]